MADPAAGPARGPDGGPEAATAPVPAQARIPAPRRGRNPHVDIDELADRLTADLAADLRDVDRPPRVPWRRSGVAALLGSLALFAVLMILMTVVGSML